MAIFDLVIPRSYRQLAGITSFGGLGYDIDNRLTALSKNNVHEEYRYLADNKRFWKRTSVYGNPTEEYYLSGVGGQRIVTYRALYNQQDRTMTLDTPRMDVYFGGRAIWQNGQAVVQDRLGSVMARRSHWGTVESHDYYPYGEERASTVGDRNKFGAYHRDQTGLDYADQRYYSSAIGRFLTSDPLIDTTRDSFSYAGSDPVNFFDPGGTARIGIECNPVYLRNAAIATDGWCGDARHGGGGPDPLNPLRQGDSASMARYNSQASAFWMAAWGNDMIRSGNVAGALSLAATNPFINPIVTSRIEYCLASVEICRDPVTGNAVPNPAGPIGLQDDVQTLADLLGVSPSHLIGMSVLRRNLLRGLSEAEIAAAAEKQAHHWLPQQFRTRFSDLGINIDSAEYGSLVESSAHRWIHSQRYNDLWDDWFRKNLEPTREAALKYMEFLRGNFMP